MVHDFVQKVDAVKADSRRFYVSPARWRKSRVTTALHWCKVKFLRDNKSLIPAQRGIYAFTVQHDNDHFPPHGFIMYIGITGEVAKNRTLQKRFMDYLYEKKRAKRPKVHYMLNKYEKDLYFYYCPIADGGIDLGELELNLNDAILPPVVVKDFSAEIRELVRALD